MTGKTTRRTAVLPGLVACALLAGACSESEPEQKQAANAEHTEHVPASTPAPAAASEGAQVYEGILGVIAELPEAGNPASNLRIHHEHIPSFLSPKTGEVNVNADGSLGMKPMTMPFPPGEGLDLSGLAVGDKVRFTLTVWTQPTLSFAVTKIEKLDPSTAISFDLKAP